MLDRASHAGETSRQSRTGWKPTHYFNNVGASIGGVLKPAGLAKSVGLISTQYFRDSNDEQWKRFGPIIGK